MDAVNSLAAACGDLARELALWEQPTRDNTGRLRDHLYSWSRMLPKASTLELDDTVQRCAGALDGFVDGMLARKMAASAPSGASPISGNEYVLNIIEQGRALQDAFNTLTLSLSIRHSADQDQNVLLIKTLQEGYKKIAGQVFDITDDILQSQHAAVNGNTFAVKEMELVVPDVRTRRSKNHETICPNASFSCRPTFVVSKILKLICCCKHPAASHDGRMEYHLKSASFLVERVGVAMESTWQMVLDKPSTQAVVSVIFAGAAPEIAIDLKQLSIALALRLMKKGEMPTGWPLPVADTAGSLTILSSICDPAAFFKKLPTQIRVHTPAGAVVLAWKPQFMQACHFMTTPRRAMEERASFGLPWITRPQSRFRLVASKDLTPRDPQHENAVVIDISQESFIVAENHRLGPLWVTLSEVDMHQGADLLRHSQLDFEFSCRQHAKSFADHIMAFKHRLLQNYCQGAFSDETEIFIHDPVSMSLGSSDTGTHISVIRSNNPLSTTKKHTSRMVVRSNGVQGLMCLDFADKSLEVFQKGLQNSQGLIAIWLQNHRDSTSLKFEQTNWEKILQRRPASVSRRLTVGGAQVIRDRELSSEDWLNDVDELRYAMSPRPSVKGKYTPVKVCVIDTGFNDHDPQRSKVKMFRDFVDPGNTKLCDRTGHGTMSATTILSIFDDCDLYIARILDTNDTDNDTGPALMAAAIEWAIAPTQDVDIISISAGFQNHSPKLQEAVQKASGKDKLVLAAASNWGNANRVAYPARHELYTMCIFSTDALNRPSAFNPEPRPHAYNFALLGEWRGPGGQGSVEGSSMATAAAAGLAALVVDFSRHADNAGIVRVGDVGKMLGMTAVFNAMHIPADRFKCVVPKGLFRGQGYGRPMNQMEMRQHVRDSISRAMDDAN